MYLDNRRVVKMIIESAQMLSTAVIYHMGLTEDEAARYGIYKSTHANHPCAVWARQTLGNFLWLHSHGMALLNEYSKRYNKPRSAHKAFATYNRLGLFTMDILNNNDPLTSSTKITPFANCAKRADLGLDFTGINDTHEAYRQYLAARWAIEQQTRRLHEKHYPAS